MDKLDRIYRLHHFLLNRRYPVSVQAISEHLECSDKTTYRLCRELIDRYNAPINESKKGYRFYDIEAHEHFELPGLWFNDEELHALLAAYQYLSLIEPGFLDDQIRPLKTRIEKLLQQHRQSPEKTLQRIRILGIGKRTTDNLHFAKIANAVLEDKQLQIRYTGRADNRRSKRTVSPQRLIHYRDNWYLDAWCHKRNALRTFALDQIDTCLLLDQKADPIDEHTLDKHLASAYGIFAGEANQTATLRFNEKRARWVSKEQWHPRQQGYWENGHYILQLPFRKSEELIMDILKYGPDVEVLAPESLRRAVKNQIREMAAPYGP